MIRLSIALSVIFAAACAAQVTTGSLVGSLKDPGGLAVAGATVIAIHQATDRQVQAQTNEQGDFVLNGLEPGNYTVRVAHPGFKNIERKGVMLNTGERVPLGDMTLELGAISETVSVTSQGAVVQTRSAERADVVTPHQVESLTIRGRNVGDLAQLLPGVVMGAPQDEISSTSTFYVQGNRATTNNVAFDGIPATDMGNGSQLKLTVSQDAVAEVRILVSNYQAEYGRMAGSNIQVITKSGSRDFHGLASYFKRNESYDANNFFNNQNGLGRSRTRYNTWTYNVGGPIYIPGEFNRNREKLFFSWSQEFWPISHSTPGQLTVPTDAERRGDYSQSVDLNGKLIPVRDPLSNAPFPGNIIPANRLDPSGTALLKAFAAPNYFDRNVSKGQYNYVFAAPTSDPKYTHSLKVDYNLNSNNVISGSWNAFNEHHTGSVGIPDAGGLNWPLMTKTWGQEPRSYGLRYNRIFSPALLNEFSFGFLSQPAQDTYSDSELAKVQRDKVGFTAGQFNPSNNLLNIIPNATFAGVPSPANLTVEGRFPLLNEYHIFTFSDSLTWTRGSHTLKVGIYAERYRRNQRTTVAFNGAFDFSRSANNPLDSGWPYSNASLGIYNTYTEVTNRLFMGEQSTAFEWFAQDTWKVSRRLTMDYGMRFYVIPPITEAQNRLAGFNLGAYDPAQRVQLIQPGFDAQHNRVGVDPRTGQIYNQAQIGAVAPSGGNPYDGMTQPGAGNNVPAGLFQTRGVQYGPRIGLAYDLTGNGKTAIRTGFGAFYNRFFDTPSFLPFVGQPPIVNTPILNFGQVSQIKSSTGLVYPTNVFGVDAQGLLPMVMNYSFSIQRDIGFGTLVDVGYAGSLGRHLYWRRDLNQIALGADFNPQNFDPTSPGKALPAAFLRPIPGYNNINIVEGGGSSNYNSLQASVKRRFRKSVEFGLSWTWSKAMDFNDNDTDTINTLVPLRVWNYGLASFDRTHVLIANYIYDLPTRKWSSAPARYILNGWQLSGITNFTSGSPLAIGFSTTTALDITGTPSVSPRPNITGNPILAKGDRTFSRNFNTGVFQMPAIGTVGNEAKTEIRGPGINNWDTALFKFFPITEHARLQFRWELYNVFNHTQFSALDTTARFDSNTGAQINARFGAFTAARNPRQMQFALRFMF